LTNAKCAQTPSMSDRPWYSVKDLHSVANYVGACKSQWKMVYDQNMHSQI